MNDLINNRMDSYRERLNCLDKPEHVAVWSNRPPLKFTEKAGAVRTAMAELVDMAGRQSAPTTGNAAEKRKEEAELEDAAHRIGRAVVSFCSDRGDAVTAEKYDITLSGWRRLRDEALIGKARQLEADATALLGISESEDYGLTAAAVAALASETDDYQALVATPRRAISERHVLTASLNPKSREVAALFDQLDDLALQFAGTPEGDAFVTAWQAAGRVIRRGQGPLAEPPAPANAN